MHIGQSLASQVSGVICMSENMGMRPNLTLPPERSTRRTTPATLPPDEVDRFLHAPALGDHVLGHHVALALLDGEAAHRQHRVGLARGVHALALHLLGENALDPQFARDLVTYEDAPDRGRNDAVDALAELAALDRLARNFAAQLLGDARVPKHVGALEIAVGMKFGPKLEMPFEERTRGLESFQYLFFGHGLPLSILTAKVRLFRMPARAEAALRAPARAASGRRH